MQMPWLRVFGQSNTSPSDEADAEYTFRSLIDVALGRLPSESSTGLLWLQFRHNAEQLLPYLQQALGSTSSEDRLVSAFLLHLLQERAADCPLDAELAARAHGELARAINSGSDQCRNACKLFANGPVPQSLVEGLERLVRSEDAHIACYAACALSTTGARSGELIAALAAGLQSTDLEVRSSTATALGRLANKHERGLHPLIAALSGDSDEAKNAALQVLPHLGKIGRPATEALVAMCHRTAESPLHRAQAAATLGMVSSPLPTVMAALDASCRSSDPEVVEGGVRGFVGLSRVPNSLCSRLIDLLGSEDRECQLSAARSLEILPGDKSEAVLPLIRRLLTESEIHSMFVYARAAASCGAVAIPPLIAALREDPMARMGTCGVALSLLRGDAVRRLFTEVLREEDYTVKGVLLSSIREMGPDSLPAIPLIADLLVRENSEPMCELLLGAVTVFAPITNDLLPGLLRCFLMGGDSLATKAERALTLYGPTARPYLEEAIESASHVQRVRIERIGKTWQQSESLRFDKFVKFGRLELLERFWLSTGLLISGNEYSIRDMEQILSARAPRGVYGERCFVSYTMLREAVQTVESHFLQGRKAIGRKEGQKGKLTAEGRQLYGEIDAYLSHLRAKLSTLDTP